MSGHGMVNHPHGRDARATRALIIVAVLGVAGMLLMLLATRFGVGIDPDSTVYLDAAQNLLHGSGLTVFSGRTGELIPLTHYPPLYPALLALIGKSGLSLESAARMLNAVLFGANAALVGFIISLYARDSFWLPVLGSLLTLGAVDMATAHSRALTEPLFIFLTLLGLISLALYLENQRRRFLIAAAVAIACAPLTRYVGIVSVITGCLVLLPGTAGILRAKSTSPRTPKGGRDTRRSLLDAFLFGSISCFPMVLWAIRNQLLSGQATDRQIVFHPVKLQQVVSGFSTVAQWLLLGKVFGGLRLVGFLIEIVMIGGLILYLRRGARETLSAKGEGAATKLPHILGVFIIVYVAFLIFTASFIDADTVFDGRSLLPVHVAGIVLVLCLVRDLYLPARGVQFARIALVMFVVLLVASHSFRFVVWLKRTSKDGQGYASRKWTDSETIAAVKSMASGISIYSNGHEAIYYLTGRRAILIPAKIVHRTGRANANYEMEMEQMSSDVRAGKVVLVYFHTLQERVYLPRDSELRSRLSLPTRDFPDGSIFEP